MNRSASATDRAHSGGSIGVRADIGSSSRRVLLTAGTRYGRPVRSMPSMTGTEQLPLSQRAASEYIYFRSKVHSSVLGGSDRCTSSRETGRGNGRTRDRDAVRGGGDVGFRTVRAACRSADTRGRDRPNDRAVRRHVGWRSGRRTPDETARRGTRRHRRNERPSSTDDRLPPRRWRAGNARRGDDDRQRPLSNGAGRLPRRVRHDVLRVAAVGVGPGTSRSARP